jgi:hypothetical protein
MLILIGPRPAARGVDALQHVGHRKVHVVHAPEDGVVQRVQADRDALQARVAQRLGLARQQRAVGGERDVQRLAVRRAQRGQLAISTSRFLRSSGSPPVRRSLRTPCATNRRAPGG